MGAPVVLLTEAASPFHFRAIRAAGPAIFQTPLFLGPSYKTLPNLKKNNVYALSPRGLDIYTAKLPKAFGLALGLEGPGLDSLWPPEKKLAIPMEPGVESLNGSQAAAKALAIIKAKNLHF
jgi:tRNA G18 (ribose-2'-O)-methylase SpoU